MAGLLARRFALTRSISVFRYFSNNSTKMLTASIEGFTPEEIVSELDKHIVGQVDAKKSVALALRNRMRRAKLDAKMQAEVYPMNIMLIGSTGTGKTEIARRMAKLVEAPFVKVEATSFTEVGVVGPNTDSMIQDLVENAVQLETERCRRDVRSWAESEVEDILVDLLAGSDASKELKQTIRKQLRDGELEEKEVSVDMRELNRQRDAANGARRAAERAAKRQAEAAQNPNSSATARGSSRSAFGGANPFGGMGGIPFPPPGFMGGAKGGRGGPQGVSIDLSGLGDALQNMFEQMQGDMNKKSSNDSGKSDSGKSDEKNKSTWKSNRMQKFIVRELRPILAEMEENRKIDFEEVQENAIRRAENHGIIFLDEIDKLANSTEFQNSKGARGVKGDGVQKELLAISEGTTIQTSYGPVNTNHMLFIGAGAFHVAKPSDLLPELQGRFPIRVELKALSQQDLRRILTEPQFNLLEQQVALLATEGVKVEFSPDGIDELARVAVEVNSTTQNIGARRLRTIVSKVLEDISFNAPSRRGATERIDAGYVRQKVGTLAQKTDLSRYII